MPRHIVRLVLLMVAFALLAYGAKQFFTVGSFYGFGHYQGKSVAEIAAEKPKYKGTAYCTSCHAQQAAVWSTAKVHAQLGAKRLQMRIASGSAYPTKTS